MARRVGGRFDCGSRVGETRSARRRRETCVVRELDLACNAVGAAGARALGAALDSGVEEIDLGNNALGDEGAKCVAKALKENASTRKVLLAGNDIGAEGAWWIADAMCVNADVRWLDLGSNRVGDGGAEDIAEELKTNAGVQFLDLRRNDIGARGAEALADAAEANDGLTGVCLRGNRVDARCQANVRARVGLRVDGSCCGSASGAGGGDGDARGRRRRFFAEVGEVGVLRVETFVPRSAPPRRSPPRLRESPEETLQDVINNGDHVVIIHGTTSRRATPRHVVEDHSRSTGLPTVTIWDSSSPRIRACTMPPVWT